MMAQLMARALRPGWLLLDDLADSLLPQEGLAWAASADRVRLALQASMIDSYMVQAAMCPQGSEQLRQLEPLLAGQLGGYGHPLGG